MHYLSLLLLILIITACGDKTVSRLSDTPVEETILQVLKDQSDGWNRGDIDAYMSGYWLSDSLRFASGGSVTFGYKPVSDRYKKRYSNKALMGKLIFDNLDVQILSQDAAIVFGRWQVKREKDHPWGLFTLLFRLQDNEWRIVHDHTSAGEGDFGG